MFRIISVLIIALFISGQSYTFCQKDTLVSIRLTKALPRDYQKVVFINPKKYLYVYTMDHKTIGVFGKKYTITDHSILYKTDTIEFSNIRKLQGYKFESAEKKTARVLFYITGSALVLVGLYGMAPRYGGSDNYNNWISYKTRFDKFRNTAIVGVAFTIGGISLSNFGKLYNIENEWTIKKGYYMDKKR